MVLIRYEEEPGDDDYQDMIQQIREYEMTLTEGREMLGRIRGCIGEYLPRATVEQQGLMDYLYQGVVDRILLNRTSFALWQRFLIRMRGFITELGNEQTAINEGPERPEENTNTTAPNNPEEEEMRTIFGHIIRALYQRAGILERETEMLRDDFEQTREALEQEQQIMRMRRFQRDLDDDRHFGGF